VPILHAIVLALVQGLTEFLPISSSAHLVLAPWVLDWPDQGLAFDVVVHLGTLAAVCGYFRADLLGVASGWLRGVTGRAPAGDADARLGWLIIAATVPVGLAGLMLKDWVETVARDPMLIGATSIAFGLLLWGADHWGGRSRGADRLGWRDAVVVGLAQAVALVPGVSRSGVTITAGRALGLDREAAARFSFLLAVPVIALSGVLEVGDLVRTGVGGALLGPLLTGFAVSAVSAYLCIRYFLRFLQRHSMDVFVAYRVVLGILILGAPV
jgi:undecaprenyl-diphosphatase